MTHDLRAGFCRDGNGPAELAFRNDRSLVYSSRRMDKNAPKLSSSPFLCGGSILRLRLSMESDGRASNDDNFQTFERLLSFEGANGLTPMSNATLDPVNFACYDLPNQRFENPRKGNLEYLLEGSISTSLHSAVC